MKVICIDDRTLLSRKRIKGLTIGKTYNVIYPELYLDCSAKNYQIIDDTGSKVWYNNEVLIPLDKYRELKLKDLGI